jgi:hypothetical protein
LNIRHLCIPDSHAHPGHSNDRADWLGKAMFDLKPDIVVHLGDSADMSSLRHDSKGKLSFEGKRYRKDIASHLDFQERMWHQYKKHKKRKPLSYFLIGNHEDRISRYVDLNPELDGVISMDDLELEEFYDEVVPYDGLTPGIKTINGVDYAHYMVSGVANRPISGQHLAYNLNQKRHRSSTVGHNHTLSFDVQVNDKGNTLMSLCAGVYQDYKTDWAGQAEHKWWKGLIVKDFSAPGVYSPTFISIEELKEAYN